MFVQVVKKSAQHVHNLLFFIHVLGSFRLTFLLSSPSPSPSSLLPGFIDVRKRLGIRTRFSQNACHVFARYIGFSRFGPLMNYFVCPNIRVERKKTSVVLEK